MLRVVCPSREHAFAYIAKAESFLLVTTYQTGVPVRGTVGPWHAITILSLTERMVYVLIIPNISSLIFI